MEKIRVKIDTFPYLVDKDNSDDKLFFLKNKEKLKNIELVVESSVALLLEKRKLGETLLFTYDSDEPEFRPKRMPPAVKRLLQNRIEEASENIVDISDIFKLWFIADELTSASKQSSSTSS